MKKRNKRICLWSKRNNKLEIGRNTNLLQKEYLSTDKRMYLRKQKDTYHIAKGHLLEGKRIPFRM